MYTVLLADDSKPIRRVVETTLDRDDIDLRLADNSGQALELVEGGFRPDLALIDVHMPHMDGLELCRRLKNTLPEVQVLLLVGTFEPFEEQEGRAAGAADHLLKPFSVDDLREKVDSMLGGAGRAGDGAEATSVDTVRSADPADERFAGEEAAPESAPADSPGSGAVPAMLTGGARGSEHRAGESSAGRDEFDQLTTAALPDQALSPEQERTAVFAAGSGDDSKTLRLSSEDLDALALRVTQHLRETLFADGVDEFVARIAGQEVRSRIERLERELAEDEADES